MAGVDKNSQQFIFDDVGQTVTKDGYTRWTEHETLKNICR